MERKLVRDIVFLHYSFWIHDRTAGLEQEAATCRNLPHLAFESRSRTFASPRKRIHSFEGLETPS